MRAKGKWMPRRDANGGTEVHAQVFLLTLAISVHRAGGTFTTEKYLAPGAPERHATRLERVEGKDYGG